MILFKELLELFPREEITEFKVGNWRIISTEYGGRILGVFHEDSPNLLWTNPELSRVLERREFNVGGVRTWISPERNFYYSDPENFKGWFCPPEIDPSSYTYGEKSEKHLILHTSFKLRDLLNHETLDISLTRKVRFGKSDEEELLIYFRDALIAREFERSRIALWALAQVYPGRDKGVVVVPTGPHAKPIHYFIEIPEDRLMRLHDHIEFLIDGKEIYKLGVAPEDLRPGEAASIGYISLTPWNSKKAFYLIFTTTSNPLSQEECLDIPKLNPMDRRAAIQSYNSGPDLKFGEIELQFPAAESYGDIQFSTVTYLMRCYVGEINKTEELFRKVLNIEKIKIKL